MKEIRRFAVLFVVAGVYGLFDPSSFGSMQELGGINARLFAGICLGVGTLMFVWSHRRIRARELRERTGD